MHSSPEDDPNMIWERFDPRNEEHIALVVDRMVEQIRDDLRGTLSPCELALADRYVHRLRAVVEERVRRDCAAMSESEDRATRH